MSEDKKDKQVEKTKKRSWKGAFKRFIKISLILGIFIFIALTILSRIGGNGEPFKIAIQDVLSDSTPYSVQIQTLNNMRIFPSISVDVEGVEFREGDATGEAQIRVSKAKLSLKFFDVLFRPGHFRHIEMQELSAAPGSLLKQAVTLKSVSVEDDGTKAALKVQGQIGQTPLNASIGLTAQGTPTKRVYSIGNERPLDITLGALHLESDLKNRIGGGFKLENMTLSVGEEKALRGNFDIRAKGEGRFHIKGQGRLQPGNTQLDPDLLLDFSGKEHVISGKIDSPELTVGDFAAKAPFMRMLDEIAAIFGSGKKEVDFTGLDLDIKMQAAQVKSGALNLGSLNTPLTLKKSALHIGPLGGKVINGNLSGDIRVNAQDNPAALETKITIKNFDYAALQKQLKHEAEIEGTAHITLDLKSKGKTATALVDGLSGKAGFVGGKARMRSGLLNIWGGGLLNALLPDFEENNDLNVNCVVANLDIENLKAQSDAVFVDTQRVTLRGKGTYDFKADHLEMVLEPKPKDISIGDISAAINLSGPLSDLKTAPNAFDLGKKVGGLLLGAVNPAFYALTLADLGLNENHPCKAFVIEKEVLPPPESPPEEKAEEEALTPMPTPNE
jgi:hypothetical protein